MADSLRIANSAPKEQVRKGASAARPRFLGKRLPISGGALRLPLPDLYFLTKREEMRAQSSSDHENLTFTIGPNDVGVRLDAFLASQIEGWSRARLQRLIESEDVLVNGKPAKASHKLREHDELEVELISPATTSFTPEAIPIEIV